MTGRSRFFGVPGAIEDKGLSGDKDSLEDTVVTVPFLEQELANGYYRSKDMVYDQRETIDDILRSISDLVSLDPFSTEAVDDELDKADLKLTQTAEAVRELDQALVQEYSGSESDQQYVKKLFAELIEATRQGGDVSPIHFDAEAYHDSAVYQLQGEKEQETAAYLEYKEQQEKTSELTKKEKAEKAEKAEPFLTAAFSILALNNRINKGIQDGLFAVAKDTAVGLWNTVTTSPILVAENIVRSAIHPVKTYDILKKAIVQSYDKNMMHGDAYTRSKWITYAAATLAVSALGTKGVDKIGKLAETGELVSKAEAIKKAGKTAKETAKLKVKNAHETVNQSIPKKAATGMNNLFSHFFPQYAVADALGEIPCNVINAAGLRDKVAKITDKISSGAHSFIQSLNNGKNLFWQIASNKINGGSKGAGDSRIIPGTPEQVVGGDSTKLGKNILEEMGVKRSTKWSGYQAQHIIPAEMAGHPVLQKIGMNLDDVSNGIFLRVPDDKVSSMSRHRGYHSVYNEVVKRELDKIDVNQSIDVLERQVFKLQQSLKYLQQKRFAIISEPRCICGTLGKKTK
ncbi:T7SS effector LXG polymorphic toxin [Terrilactibacillus sp. S3-3]|nr:T7SS effector LXG polymorphic toxin [Terrilactibacillus sp. S3-3]